jgi:hypothetical protein
VSWFKREEVCRSSILVNCLQLIPLEYCIVSL